MNELQQPVPVWINPHDTIVSTEVYWYLSEMIYGMVQFEKLKLTKNLKYTL